MAVSPHLRLLPSVVQVEVFWAAQLVHRLEQAQVLVSARSEDLGEERGGKKGGKFLQMATGGDS
jgi:hypothetical protein